MRRALDRTPVLLALGLVALAVAIYWPVGGFGFVAYDDQAYVSGNEMVRRGLGWSGAAWAFRTLTAANWHPLTWLSYMLDVQLFGVDPGWHHRVNLVFHAANGVLLFAFLRSATGSLWRSALVAALFVAHPLHVESVAWISERKDVLSAFFWLLAMLAYAGYVRHPGLWRYLAVAAAFVLGLMAKPMVVTLPFALLLLDVWPLRRRPALVEKLPLFALSALSCAATWVAQARSGAVRGTQWLTVAVRVENAVVSYAAYLGKTVWPSSLAALYPHPGYQPGGIPAGQIALAAAVLVAITGVAILLRRSVPAIAVGWCWYLGTLVPVIGLVQVGQQSMADRYTYVPLIGIFCAVVWGLAALAARVRHGRIAAGAVASAAVIACAVTARHQAGYWQDSIALFDHAAHVTEGNWLAWKNLGAALYESGRMPEALAAFQEEARIDPSDPDGWFNLGMTYGELERHAESAAAFEQALRLDPSDPLTRQNVMVEQTLARPAPVPAAVADPDRRDAMPGRAAKQ